MPSGNIHRKISRMVVGDSCKAVHRFMDFPYRFLGKSHRILLHDPVSAVVVGYLLNGLPGAGAALSHILTDYVSSEMKRYLRYQKKA